MTTSTALSETLSLLQAILNLSKFHREHEKFYASSPREFAVTLQRHARSLQALADQWTVTEPSVRAPLSPYEGAEDLNSAVAIQLDGVLFMEGEGRPAEITHLIGDMRAAAHDQRATGEWLATAMQASWDMAAALIGIDGLADLLGERHRIIANDWQAAHMNTLMSHLLDPGRRHPGTDRLHAQGPARRPRRPEGLGRAAVLGGRADLPRRRPVQRFVRAGPRQRAPLAHLPAASQRSRRCQPKRHTGRRLKAADSAQRAHMAAVTGGCSKKGCVT